MSKSALSECNSYAHLILHTHRTYFRILVQHFETCRRSGNPSGKIHLSYNMYRRPSLDSLNIKCIVECLKLYYVCAVCMYNLICYMNIASGLKKPNIFPSTTVARRVYYIFIFKFISYKRPLFEHFPNFQGNYGEFTYSIYDTVSGK